MTTKKFIVLVTACLAILGFLLCWWHCSKVAPPAVRLEVGGCPALGKEGAPIEMVLFEDFRCEGCRSFNREILPKIQERYIEPGVVRFTIVPLAFLFGSKPLANAVLAVCDIAPDRWVSYVYALEQGFDEIDSPTLVQQKLVNLAKATGGIDLLAFKSCVMTDCQETRLEKNLSLAKQVMGKEFGTPTLYINGVATPAHSFEAIERRIAELLKDPSP